MIEAAKSDEPVLPIDIRDMEIDDLAPIYHWAKRCSPAICIPTSTAPGINGK